ncbi:unnamed protein product [Diamesa hyperborea]
MGLPDNNYQDEPRRHNGSTSREEVIENNDPVLETEPENEFREDPEWNVSYQGYSYTMVSDDDNDNPANDDDSSGSDTDSDNDEPVTTMNNDIISNEVNHLSEVTLEDLEYSENTFPPSIPFPEITTTEIEMQTEIWNTPRDNKPELPQIELDSSKTDQILKAMSGFQLPMISIPKWASEVSEDQWKTELLQKIRNKTVKTDEVPSSSVELK